MRLISRLAVVPVLVFAMSIVLMAQTSAAKSGGDSAEDQIKKLDDQQRQAALNSDAGFFEKYLADNYVGVDGSGKEWTKDETVQARKEGKLKYDSIDLKHRTIHMYGNTAVVDHDALVKGNFNGQTINGESRAIGVWVKQGGTWKLASFESTPVQPATSAAKKSDQQAESNDLRHGRCGTRAASPSPAKTISARPSRP